MTPPVTPRVAANDNMAVTVGVSAHSAGNLKPFVKCVTMDGIRKAASHIVDASVSNVKGALPSMKTYAQARRM